MVGLSVRFVSCLTDMHLELRQVSDRPGGDPNCSVDDGISIPNYCAIVGGVLGMPVLGDCRLLPARQAGTHARRMPGVTT